MAGRKHSREWVLGEKARVSSVGQIGTVSTLLDLEPERGGTGT